MGIRMQIPWKKLSDMDIQVFRTDEQGTIIATSDGNTISWNMDPCNDYTSGDGSSGTEVQETDGFGSSSWEESTENVQEVQSGTETEEMVWISATGSKYHSIPDCGNMNPDKAYQEPISQAESEGYEACKKCF